jgi:CelD/BcsL family acetyltransferase involved in cellulose biosynthesis
MGHRDLVGGSRTTTSSPIPLHDLRARDIAAWRELAAHAAEPNPFFEPEFVLTAARHLGDPHVGVLVVRGGGGDWLACMPVRHGMRVGRARVPALSSWRHLYCFLGTPLVAASAVPEATERLLEQALRASPLGVLVLRTVGEDGPVSAALLAALETDGREPAMRRSFSRAVMQRETLAGGVDGLISSRHRRDLRRLTRRLGESLDAPLEVHDVSDSDAAVDGFMALEAAGWKGERGTAMDSAGHGRFFRELCAAFRAAGRLQLLALGSAVRTVSYKCNLLTPEAVFCFKIAFDESLSRFRPGLQLELRMLEIFREQMSQGWMDSCADPDSQLFEHLWHERRAIGSYLISSSRAVAWTIDHGLGQLATHAELS